MSATGIDERKLEEFMGRMVGYMTGGAACFGIWLGDELGLYSALAGHGLRTAARCGSCWVQRAAGSRVVGWAGRGRPDRL